MVVRIEVSASEAEVVADRLWQAGATAVSESAADRGDGSVVVLTADLDGCPDDLALQWPTSSWVDDGAWQDGWRPFARAVRAGPFLVRPPWVTVDAATGAGAIELVLDGGRAFGTGSHPSTTLALAALASCVQRGSTVLDVGCGSGALAIGAALLGASHVVAIDVDPAAVTATAANVAANVVAGIVEVTDTPLESVPGAFDVVAANLGSPLVIDLVDELGGRTQPGGVLVLSGLLTGRADAVRRAYRAFDLVDQSADDGWVAVSLRRP
ncbi:MAG: 50S ribosomal protein L11 methyltransferase [Actinomycetota bacterium]|nr:50S ribosomal protein L11 methyltransferase [Actinomycetota bacterium]